LVAKRIAPIAAEASDVHCRNDSSGQSCKKAFGEQGLAMQIFSLCATNVRGPIFPGFQNDIPLTAVNSLQELLQKKYKFSYLESMKGV
jgi:hypothetical protein